MAVQTFNIDKSMVTCNLLTYCRSISVKKKKTNKNSRIVLVFVMSYSLIELSAVFFGHNLFDPIKFYEIIVFSRFCFLILF